MTNAKFRIGFHIRGFDTFEISVHDAITDDTISVLIYQADDFAEAIDLDSHLVDCMISEDGKLIRTKQE